MEQQQIDNLFASQDAISFEEDKEIQIRLHDELGIIDRSVALDYTRNTQINFISSYKPLRSNY